jgi:hypothetical protein
MWFSEPALMESQFSLRLPGFPACVSTFHTRTAVASVAVLTYHNDNLRTGQNVNETILTTANVNASNFGKLFSLPVDGSIFAQPFYMPGVTVGT